jgi:hypothetical protein
MKSGSHSPTPQVLQATLRGVDRLSRKSPEKPAPRRDVLLHQRTVLGWND